MLQLLLGGSGSGKTTIAKELQQMFGNNTMLISQDAIRRDMLKVKDGENTKALPLLEPKMSPGGVILCESALDEALPPKVGAFQIKKEYRYGKIKLTAYRVPQAETE